MKKIVIIILLLSCTLNFAQERLEIKKIGFSIDTPKDWFVASDAEVISNLEKYDFSEQQLDDFIKSHNESVSLGTFTKYDPKKVFGIIPTIKIIMRSNPVKSEKDVLEYVKEINQGAKMQVDKFTVVEEPVLKKISGTNAVSTAYNFTLKMGSKSYNIKANTCYIFRGSYFITLNFIEEVGKDNNDELIERLFSSIKLTNP